MKLKINVADFRLTVDGLFIKHKRHGLPINVQLQPYPLCEILQRIKAIKDYKWNDPEPQVTLVNGETVPWFIAVTKLYIDDYMVQLLLSEYDKSLSAPLTELNLNLQFDSSKN